MTSLRRSLAVLLVLSTLVAWLGQTASTLAQEPTIAIQGQVINATSGGTAVGGVTVIFHQHGSGGAINDLDTVTDEAGGFAFEGVTYDPQFTYAISVEYLGALYGQDLDLSAGSPDPIALTVYDVTNDDAALSTTRVSVLFAGADQETGTLEVLEIMGISNASDQTYVPGDDPMQLLRFSLPPDFRSLSVDTGRLLGSEVFQVDIGFALSGAVPPGGYEVLYSYELPYTRSTVSYTKTLPYGATQVRILAPSGSVQLSSAQLGVAELVTIGDQVYQLLTATDLGRGASVTVDLAGLPQDTLTNRLTRPFAEIPFEYVAPIGLVVLVALVIGYALWRRARWRQVEADLEPASSPESQRLALARRLADLQHRRDAGDLSEEEFQQRRSEVQASLVALMHERGPGTPPQ